MCEGLEGEKMPKFTVTFEMPKHHCINCPLLDGNDDCKLQGDEIDHDSWDDLLSHCPLVDDTTTKTLSESLSANEQIMFSKHLLIKSLATALKRIDPYIAEGGEYECEECGQLIVDEPICIFCNNNRMDDHADNCEYKTLTMLA